MTQDKPLTQNVEAQPTNKPVENKQALPLVVFPQSTAGSSLSTLGTKKDEASSPSAKSAGRRSKSPFDFLESNFLFVFLFLNR
jgi:hypothetical protein